MISVERFTHSPMSSPELGYERSNTALIAIIDVFDLKAGRLGIICGQAPILQLVGWMVFAILGTAPQLIGVLILLDAPDRQKLAHNPLLAMQSAEKSILDRSDYDDAQAPDYDAPLSRSRRSSATP